MIDRSRLGIFTPSLGLVETKKCLEFVRRHGGLIQGWTIDPAVAHEDKPGLDFDLLKAAVREGSVRVASLSGYMDWTEPAESNRRRNEFVRILDQCAELGCSIVCTETGRCFETRDDSGPWRCLVDSMRYLCAEAAQRDAVVAVEMGRRDLVFGVERFQQLQEQVESPALKVNFDPANLVRGGLDPLSCACALFPEIVQVHLKDGDSERMHPLTHGAVDLEGLTRLMEGGGYTGDYIIEAEYSADDRAAGVAADHRAVVARLFK